MSFLLTALGVLIVLWALSYLLTRSRRRMRTRDRVDTTPAESPRPEKSEWSRSDLIALASLVIGTLLGVVGLLAR